MRSDRQATARARRPPTAMIETVIRRVSANPGGARFPLCSARRQTSDHGIKPFKGGLHGSWRPPCEQPAGACCGRSSSYSFLQWPPIWQCGPCNDRQAGHADRCASRSPVPEKQDLLADFVVDLPEVQRAPRGVRRQLVVIPQGDPERLLIDRNLDRAVAQHRFHREPVQSG